MCREAQTQPEREQTIVFSGVESSTRPRFIRGCIPPKKKKKKKSWHSPVLGRPPPLSSARWLVMRLLIVLIRIQTDATRRRTAVKPTGNRRRRRRRIASSYKHDVRDDDRASFRNRTTALGAPGGPLFHPCLTSERIRKDAWVIAETNGRMGLQRNTHTHTHYVHITQSADGRTTRQRRRRKILSILQTGAPHGRRFPARLRLNAYIAECGQHGHSSMRKHTAEYHHGERKCAGASGTVYIFQIKYTEAILWNSTRKLLWFEISKMLIAVKSKFIVLFIVIFGPLSFPIARCG